jgi:hypothetical protein
MKLRGAIALALLAIPAVAATPAHAASTRAEYIAQVDPICQSYKGPELNDAKAFHRNHKLWVRAAIKGTVKEFARQTHRLAQSLLAWDRLHSSMTEQIAAIPPVPADAAVIDTWLNDRRQSDASADAAALALNKFQIRRFFRLTSRADKLERAGIQAINGFGFQVCGYA